MKSFLLLLLFVAIGCASREACYARVRANFHAQTEECETEECIDALSRIEAEELKGCP